jgi:competence protein ComEC
MILIGAHEWMVLPDGKTHLHFLDVGQGDSTLITTKSGKRIVIDGGPDWSTASELARHFSLFDRTIDVLILSHANLDHYASFPALLKYYRVHTLVISGIGQESLWYQTILRQARAHGTTIQLLSAGDTVMLDDGLRLNTLWPPKHLAKAFLTDLNNASLIFRIEDGTHCALFTGDSEELVERVLVQSHADLACETLKIPHHGSKTSSSLDFLQKIQTKDAVISVGKNSYGHPNSDVLRRTKSLGIHVQRTDEDGTIEYTWSH